DREMNILRGGGTPGNCNCCCGYENNGGSSSSANSSANNANGYTISYGCGDGGGGNDTGSSWGNTIVILSNWDCMGEVDCRNEPSKCNQ
ncbi:MAG: hypothetical protein LBR48_09915, partial [Dysgonamonadaceae bacterium]|nr:hypothetical protein [Dysgonamonadaceae bacterium]